MAIYHMYIGDTGPFIVNDEHDLPLSDEKQRGVTILDDTGAVVARLHVDQGNLVVRDDQSTPNEQTIALQKSTQKEVVKFQIAGTTAASFTTMQTEVEADTSDPDPDNHIEAHTVTTVQLNLPSSLNPAENSGITQVTSDDTLSGLGTSTSPLMVANAFTNVDEVNLDAQLDRWLFGVNKTYNVGDQVLHGKRIYECILQHVATSTTASDSPDAATTRWRSLSGEVGEDNVQADWNEDDDTSDAYIIGKPTGIFGSEPQTVSFAAISPAPTLNANDSHEIEVSGVGTGGFFDQGSGGDMTKVVFHNAGFYRLYGNITKTGNDRTGPSFNVVGTGVEVVGWSNPYSRDADASFTVRRQIDFRVANADTAVTFQVINRPVSTSDGSFTTEDFVLSSVSNVQIIPLVSVKGDPGDQGPPGDLTQVYSNNSLSGLGTQASPLAVAIPFTAADHSKLDGIAANAEVNVQSDWGQSTDTADDYIKNRPTVITSAERTKLANIAERAEVNVQSDWNQTTDTADDYIKNKPTPPVVPTAADAVSPRASNVTGAVGTETQYAREDHKHPKQRVYLDDVHIDPAPADDATQLTGGVKLPALITALRPADAVNTSDDLRYYFQVSAKTDNNVPSAEAVFVRDVNIQPYEYGGKFSTTPADTVASLDSLDPLFARGNFDSFDFHLQIGSNGTPYQDYNIKKLRARLQPYAAASNTAQRLFTVENDAIWSINTSTGATTKILELSESVYQVPGFSSDISEYASATYGGGFIWATFPYRSGTSGSVYAYLYKINPANGNVERVAPVSVGGASLGYTQSISLLYQGSTLYMMHQGQLSTLNVSTAVLTSVGRENAISGRGLAYDGTSVYTIGNSTSLYTVNLSTSAQTHRGVIRIGSTSGTSIRPWSIEFFGGTCYVITQDGTSSKLYSVNITSGTSANIATLVGTLTNVGGNIGTLGSGNITLVQNSETDSRNLIAFDPGNPDRRFGVWSDPDNNRRFYCYSTVELARIDIIAYVHAKYRYVPPVSA